MGEELIFRRNQFIVRLLRQNFGCVEGPRFGGGNFVFYDVWKETRDSEQGNRVRIVFTRELLAEAENDFARTTLQALRNAKSVLQQRQRGMRGSGTTQGVERVGIAQNN